jgi:hypothetical protein
LTFKGTRLFVNAEVGRDGWVKAAVLTHDSGAVAGFSLAEALALAKGTTEGRMTWQARDALEPPGDGHIRFVFELKNAKLYSFWVE